MEAGWRARGVQLVREEAGFAAQVTDGEYWIRAVTVGSRCEGGGVAGTG